MNTKYDSERELEEIRNINILDLVSRLGYTLQKKGSLYNLKEHDSLVYEYEKPLPVVQETVNNNIDTPKEKNNINKVIIVVSIAIALCTLLIISLIFYLKRKNKRN